MKAGRYPCAYVGCIAAPWGLHPAHHPVRGRRISCRRRDHVVVSRVPRCRRDGNRPARHHGGELGTDGGREAGRGRRLLGRVRGAGRAAHRGCRDELDRDLGRGRFRLGRYPGSLGRVDRGAVLRAAVRGRHRRALPRGRRRVAGTGRALQHRDSDGRNISAASVLEAAGHPNIAASSRRRPVSISTPSSCLPALRTTSRCSVAKIRSCTRSW